MEKIDLRKCSCGSNKISFTKLTHYKPKEFIVKCERCGLGVLGIGYRDKTLMIAWNRAVFTKSLIQLGNLKQLKPTEYNSEVMK